MKPNKKAFKEAVKRNKEELSADTEKFNASLERIKNLPDKQKQKVLKGLEKHKLLPKSFKDAARKLLSD